MIHLFNNNQQFAHAYSSAANRNKNAKAYQELLILIRGFERSNVSTSRSSKTSSFSFGFSGGEKYLLDVNEKNHGCVLETLSANFEKLMCYLSPTDNVCHLMHIMLQIFPAEGLNVKKLNGEQITVWELSEYIKIISANVGPNIETPKYCFHTMMIENYMKSLVNSSLDIYNDLVKKEDLNRIKNTKDIQEIHKKSETAALKVFDEAKKLGSPRNALLYKTHLENEIKKSYESWKKVSISLEGFVKFCVLKYKDKIAKEGASDLRVSSFILINHQKFKDEAISMFKERISSNLYGSPEEQTFQRYEKILDEQIEIEFKIWSKVSYSMQNLIKSCVNEFLGDLRALTVDQIKNERDIEKVLEKFKVKALKKFEQTEKMGDMKDSLEYGENLKKDLELEYQNWKEQVEVLLKYYDIAVERYKNNTTKTEVSALWTENDIYNYHVEMKEQVTVFFMTNLERDGSNVDCNGWLKKFFETELGKKIDSHFEYWSQKRMNKIQKILKVGKAVCKNPNSSF